MQGGNALVKEHVFGPRRIPHTSTSLFMCAQKNCEKRQGVHSRRASILFRCFSRLLPPPLFSPLCTPPPRGPEREGEAPEVSALQAAEVEPKQGRRPRCPQGARTAAEGVHRCPQGAPRRQHVVPRQSYPGIVCASSRTAVYFDTSRVYARRSGTAVCVDNRCRGSGAGRTSYAVLLYSCVALFFCGKHGCKYRPPPQGFTAFFRHVADAGDCRLDSTHRSTWLPS